MPALAQSRSTLPHFSVALATIALTCSKFETSAPSAIASPPALRISSTTASAGVSDPPVPSRAPPKSLTTTLAPRLASPSACARPRPLPAPVTMATRPSNLIVMIAFLVFLSSCPDLIRASIKNDGSILDQRWIAGSIGIMTRSALLSGNDRRRLSEVNQADPVGDQGGLVLALDLDRHIGARLQLLRLAQFRLGQRETAADA